MSAPHKIFSIGSALLVLGVWLVVMLDLRSKLQDSQRETAQAKTRQEWAGAYLVQVLKAFGTNDVAVSRNFSTNWSLSIRTTGEVAIIHYSE